MPTALAAPSSSRVPADDEMSLAELLDLFDPAEQASSPSSPSRTAGTGLRALRKTWARRSAAWNIAPGGAWRAW